VADWADAALALWRQAAAVVFADVEATTDIRWTWQVTLHEDEEDWSPRRRESHEPGAQGIRITWRPTYWEPPRRPLLVPELWLEAHGNGTLLGVGYDLNEAVEFVAERVQDWIIDDTRHAWPECPRHQHPADLGNHGATPTWVCPLDNQLIAEVGKLGGAA
jgi:hypothetical protein